MVTGIIEQVNLIYPGNPSLIITLNKFTYFASDLQ